MLLKNKNILLISPEPWGHIFVSKHHYAVHLGKRGNKVFFLSPPSNAQSVEKTEYENVFSISYGGFPQGLRFYPVFLQRYFIRKKFNLLQNLCEVQFDIVWSFDNSVFFDFSTLSQKVLTISHIVDLNQNFNTVKTAKTADLCLGVIPKIVDRLTAHNRYTYLVNHGVQSFKEADVSVELPGNNRVKAMYIGNLNMKYIDWPLLEKLTSKNSHVDFMFFGENNSEMHYFFDRNNVFYLGKVLAEKIPAYLNCADILLIVYSKGYYKNYATPHKMMEYLASGKMICATWTEEYEELHEKGLIKMSRTADEYLKAFSTVVSGLAEHNNIHNQEQRTAYALNNTYDRQIDRIEGFIQRLPYDK